MSDIVEHVLGAFLLEMFMAVLLYGITSAQAYFYWCNYPEDPKLVCTTVFAVWLVETIHTAFCLDLIYRYIIIDFGNMIGVEQIVWSAGCVFCLMECTYIYLSCCDVCKATVITAVLIAAIVQSFFIRRIWILSHKSITITVIPAVLLFSRFVFGCATASLTWKIETWAEFRSERGPRITFTCGLTLAAVVDFIIALSQIYYLWRGRTGYKATDHLTKTLMAYVINTGALTMMVSLATLITFLVPALKTSLLFAGLVEIQSKLYANSFLATLNNRQRLSKSANGEFASNSIELSGRRRMKPRDAKPLRNIEIYRQTAVVRNDPLEEVSGSVTLPERSVSSMAFGKQT